MQRKKPQPIGYFEYVRRVRLLRDEIRHLLESTPKKWYRKVHPHVRKGSKILIFFTRKPKNKKHAKSAL